MTEMNILKYYRNRNHPEMEPFPVLKSIWGVPESQLLKGIKSLNDNINHMSRYRFEDTRGMHPELKHVPFDEWPEEVLSIWYGYKESIRLKELEIKGLYRQILELERQYYSDLDPFELRLVELKVFLHLQDNGKPAKRPFGIETLYSKTTFEEMNEERGYPDLKPVRIPEDYDFITLVDVKYASDEEVDKEIERLAGYGIDWIEDQERLLLGLPPLGGSIDQVLRFNRQFVGDHGHKPFITDKYPEKKLAILTCMDTRLTVLLQEALGLKNGDAKIIKNAGGIIQNEKDSAIRSILVAIYELGVNEVMVIHHTTCGACHMSYKEFSHHMVERGISPDTLEEWERDKDIGDWLEGFHDTEASVRKTVATIVNHPLVPKDVTVRGFIIDSVTGELTEIE